jgi:branched-chain amino acid transport system permease protein
VTPAAAAATTLVRTRDAVGGAAADLRRAWTLPLSAAAGAWAAAAILLPFVPGVRVDAVAADVYLAFAATALGYCVGIGGTPVLGFGGFMAVGAFTAALLIVRAGWPFPAAALAGAAAAAAGGLCAGIGVIRLRPVFLAASTWLLAWLVAIFLAAFPSVSGGAQGLVFVAPGAFLGLQLTPTVHLELALVLLAAGVAAFAVLSRARPGLSLSAARQRRRDAEALGVRTARLRLGAFVGAATAGGLAGALATDLAGVADPSSYGIFLSLKLFVAVVVGGAASALGPAAGVAIVVAVFAVADPITSAIGVEPARFDPALAAVLLLVVLGLGGDGVVPLLARLVPLPTRAPPRADARPRQAAAAPSTGLRADGLRKTFGELVAVDDVSLELRPGEVRALIGPNGSGKTTALRLLGGSLRADRGRVTLGERDVSDLPPPERVRAGIAHTRQGAAGFPRLTALDHVLVAASARARYAGAVRALAATPLSRAETAEARAEALALLERFGLGYAAERPVAQLGGPERALLLIVAAYATGARVLLLDEPGAGGTREESRRLVQAVEGLRGEGTALLLVEHDLRLVRALADRVLVLDAGRTIAEGTPSEIGRDAAVRRAYLGPARL